MDVNGAIIQESAVDWITATAKREDRAGRLANLGAHLCQLIAADGNVERLFDWRGYTLHRSGPCAYGTRYDGSMLQLSGALASSHWLTAAQDADHIARLDLQVTVKRASDVDDIATRGYLHTIPLIARRGHRTTYSHVENSEGGSTLYVGSRSSEQSGRLYNKWAESRLDHYRGCWRYEVELKNDLATHAAMLLAATEHRETFISGFVHRWFENRDVVPVFDTTSPFDLHVPPKLAADFQRQLEWLGGQVRPTVGRLRQAGLLAKVVDVLQLSDVINVDLGPLEYGGNGNHGADMEGVE